MVSPQQAYDFALLQERQGNYQAAFDTLVDLQQQFPNFLDVPNRLAGYSQRNFRYSGTQSFFRQQFPPPAYGTDFPTQPANFVSPSPPPSGGRQAWMYWAIGVALLILVGAIAVIAVVLTGKKDPTPVANNSTPAVTATTAAQVTTTLPQGGITQGSITTVRPVTTRATTTAAPVTTESSLPDTPTTTQAAKPSPTVSEPTVDPDEMSNLDTALAKLPKGASGLVILPTGDYTGVNEETQLPAASLIKLWIAAAVYQDVTDGLFKFSDSYVLKKEDQATGTGIMNQASMVGKTFTYRDTVYNMLVHSDNTAANILINKLGGFQKVNDWADQNGYSQTRLQRKMGQPDPNHENYTSAKDLGQFLYDLVDGYIIDDQVSSEIRQMLMDRPKVGDNSQDSSLNMFGSYLTAGTTYGHISGQNTGLRGEAGFFYKKNGLPVIVVAIIAGNEKDAEQAISRLVGEAWTVTSGRP